MEYEWPVWRIIVDSGISLTEINRWDLEDIDKVNNILDMRSDYEAALRAKKEKDMDK